MITSIGLVVVPLSLAIVLARPEALLVFLALCMPLNDAAVLNYGSFSLGVPWYAALLLIARAAFDVLARNVAFPTAILRRALPLYAFMTICFVSTLIALFFFQGKVEVLPPSAAFSLAGIQKYAFVEENINQLIYLVILVVAVYCTAFAIWRTTAKSQTQLVDVMMYSSFIFSTSLVLWHMADINFGIYFPEYFFHSDNATGAWNQAVAGVIRPAGPYSEPSSLTYYYGLYLFYFWWRGRQGQGAVALLATLTAVAMLFLSTSTGAVIILAVFAVLALGLSRTAARLAGRLKAMPRLRPRHLASAAVLLAALWYGHGFYVRNAQAIADVFEAQVMTKSESTSYTERSTADRMVFQIYLDTYGLGIGLGSHRPNSGVLNVLSSTGVVGSVVVLLFFVDFFVRRRRCLDASADDACAALKAGTAGLLICHVFGSPNLHSIPLILTIGTVIGLQTRFSTRVAYRARCRRVIAASRVRAVSAAAFARVPTPAGAPVATGTVPPPSGARLGAVGKRLAPVRQLIPASVLGPSSALGREEGAARPLPG